MREVSEMATARGVPNPSGIDDSVGLKTTHDQQANTPFLARGERASAARLAKAPADVAPTRFAAFGLDAPPQSIPIPDEWPELCEAQPAMGNEPPTFDPSAPAVLWVMAPGGPGLRLKLGKEITRIPGTLEELVPGACSLMKSGHTAIIVHGGGVWLAERIREAAGELKRRRL